MGFVSRNERRERRHRRARQKVFGTAERPRLCVYKSLKHLYAQVIDDVAGQTLVSASTLEKALNLKDSTIKSAQILGKVIAERAQQQGIQAVVFDRSGYSYHGVVKALAQSCRKAGLQF